MTDTITGVDFGTSTTLVAQRRGLQPARVVPIGATRSWIPTLAALDGTELLTGEAAEAMPEDRIIRSVKNALFEDREEVSLGFDEARVNVDEVVCAILSDVRKRSEEAHAELSSQVRLACPAIWTAKPRERLVSLACAAGLRTSVDAMLDEPIAAGVSWVMNSFYRLGTVPEGRVLVFDYGGGTLDVALLQVEQGERPEITVLSAAGRAEAGDAFDNAIRNELVAEIAATGQGAELVEDPAFQQLVRLAARRLKEILSAQSDAQTSIGAGFGTSLRYSRAQLEAAVSPLLDRAMGVVVGVLRSAELRRRDIDHQRIRQMSREDLVGAVDHVLLSGGMARAPIVAARLQREFPESTVGADPGLTASEESVVAGLTFEEVVSDLNLHRPAFSFVAHYVDREGSLVGMQTLYEAFAPLYKHHQIATMSFGLRHYVDLDVPRGVGVAGVQVRCEDTRGGVMPMDVAGQHWDSLNRRIRETDRSSFSLYVDGRIVIGGPKPLRLRVERWPVLRGGATSPIELEVEQPDGWAGPLDPNWWVGGE